MALLGFGMWSLVWGHVVGRLIRTLIACWLIMPKFTIAIKFSEVKTLLTEGVGYKHGSTP